MAELAVFASWVCLGGALFVLIVGIIAGRFH